MKAKVKQMFKDLGLIQTFARPRTPNDNPYVEALFSTVKTTSLYPGLTGFPVKMQQWSQTILTDTSLGIITNTIIHGSDT